MATFKSFEDTPVWKLSAKFAAEILPWTSDSGRLRGKGDMANQIQRAALSISNNIAEGFDRGSNNELTHFLYIAKGSTSEVRSMLKVLQLMDNCPEDVRQIKLFVRTTEDISRQLGGWINSLKNSKIKGPKYLNDETKRDYEREKGREKTLAALAESKEQLKAKIYADLERRRKEQDKT